MELKDSKIIKAITEKAYDRLKDNADTIEEIIKAKNGNGVEFSEIITPVELSNAMVNYLGFTANDNVENFKDMQNKIEKMVFGNPVFQQMLASNGTGLHEIGLSLAIAGTKLMELECYEDEVVNEFLDNGTLTEKDIEDLSHAHLHGLSDETGQRIAEFFDVDIHAEIPLKKTTSRLKVTDKNSVIQLIKSNRISTQTLYMLLQSKEIDVMELMGSLDSDSFNKVMANVNEYAKTQSKAEVKAPVPAQSSGIETTGCDQEKCVKCEKKVECQAMKGRLKELLDVAKQGPGALTKMAMNDENISYKEKAIRKAIIAGDLTIEDIVEAVTKKELNPFFLDGHIKPNDPVMYAKVTLGILKKNAPQVIDNIAKEGDPLEVLIKKAIKENDAAR